MGKMRDKIIDLGFTGEDADDMLSIVNKELAAKDKEIERLKEMVVMLEAKIENLEYELMGEDR